MNDDYLSINEDSIVEVSPTASSDMQQAFIENFRDIQAENTAQLGEQAHALGSDLPAELGGLHGPSEYWVSRYQTPQTESRLASLRTAAQLTALNQLMQNDRARWQERYNQAYRAAANRPNTPTNPDDDDDGKVITETLDEVDVTEDPFFKRREQQAIADQIQKEQAAKKGMTLDQYKEWLAKQKAAKEAASNATSGVGAFNPQTGTFNNGL